MDGYVTSEEQASGAGQETRDEHGFDPEATHERGSQLESEPLWPLVDLQTPATVAQLPPLADSAEPSGPTLS